MPSPEPSLSPPRTDRQWRFPGSRPAGPAMRTRPPGAELVLADSEQFGDLSADLLLQIAEFGLQRHYLVADELGRLGDEIGKGALTVSRSAASAGETGSAATRSTAARNGRPVRRCRRRRPAARAPSAAPAASMARSSAAARPVQALASWDRVAEAIHHRLSSKDLSSVRVASRTGARVL